MDIYFFMTLFSGIALISCVFLTSYLILGVKQRDQKKQWLLFLIIAVGLNVSKSIVFFLFLSNYNYIPIIIAFALGFFGYSLIGPLLLFYLKSGEKKSNFYRKNTHHLLFPFIGSFLICFFGPDSFRILYLLAGLSLFLYLIYLRLNFLDKKTHIFKEDKFLVLTISILLIIFVSQDVVLQIQYYVFGIALSSIIIFRFFIYVIKKPILIQLNKQKIYNVSSENEEKIINALEIKKMYRINKLTLPNFSQKINVPQYIIQNAIKNNYQKTFPELINLLRIEEVKLKLSDPDNFDRKLEDLAYDAGYNTVSSFYAVFKRITKMTPREYQEDQLKTKTD